MYPPLRYCPYHLAIHEQQEQQRQRRRPSAQQRGYGSAWRAIRNDYISRHPMCEYPGCLTRAAIVDHITPIRRGGSNDISNLQALCDHHHASKTRKEQVQDRAVRV